MACIACGRRDARPLYEVNGFPIVECVCGLARTVLPEGFDPRAIYTEEYFQGGHRDGYADYAGSGDELRHEFRRVIASLQRHVQSGKLIELGCALGFFLDEAGSTFETCGVEISEHARASCQARGLDVAGEFSTEFLQTRGPFDAAVMLDVLEHMQDPGVVLDKLHAAMRPGAQLLLTTGDYGSLLARAMGKHWRLMTPPQHLWFFSPATVTALLERHGFHVHTVDHPWKQVPLALVAYQASRYLGGQQLLKRFVPPGRLPLNLFDAMRVIASRSDDRGYELALRHAHGRVLEVECGEGHGTRLLAERGREVSEAVGLDRSADAVGLARASNSSANVRFAQGDPLEFYDDAGFDTIVALDTLGVISDPDRMIVRLVAALRTGGTIVTSFDSAALRSRLERYGMRQVDAITQGATSSIAWQRS